MITAKQKKHKRWFESRSHHTSTKRIFLPSSISPHSLNFFHPNLVFAVTAASHPPLLFNLLPRYQNPFTVSTSLRITSYCASPAPLQVQKFCVFKTTLHILQLILICKTYNHHSCIFK